MPVEAAGVEREGNARGEHELAHLEGRSLGTCPLQPGCDLVLCGRPHRGVVEGRALSDEQHALTFRVAKDDLAMGREVVAQIHGELRALVDRRLERDHLAEPRLAPVLEDDVATGLENELVEGGLEGEAPPVHRRGERENSPARAAHADSGTPRACSRSRLPELTSQRPRGTRR